MLSGKRTLKISWTDKVENKEIYTLERIKLRKTIREKEKMVRIR